MFLVYHQLARPEILKCELQPKTWSTFFLKIQFEKLAFCVEQSVKTFNLFGKVGRINTTIKSVKNFFVR